MSELPGRTCPIRYHYGARAIASAPVSETEVLYVIGGLYGNIYALRSIQALIAEDAQGGARVRACFNGDFNWFNVSEQDFVEINLGVSQHDAIVGNVEAELASDDLSAGCGCAYPPQVSDEVVEHSNKIFERLHGTALRHAVVRQYFRSLPMFARYQIAGQHVGIVHGDFESLAGWRFDVNSLRNETSQIWLQDAFLKAKVDVFASSHTCLPVLKQLDEISFLKPLASSEAIPVPRATVVKAVINNGAAGMPNFTNTHYGVISRIGLRPATKNVLHSARVGELYVEALRLDFDHLAWSAHFLKSWPKGSEAYESYFARICDGPSFDLGQAY